MKKYILQFKFKNLLHLFLIACNSAFLVGASVTLAFMTNQLVAANLKASLFGWELKYYFTFSILYLLISLLFIKLS